MKTRKNRPNTAQIPQIFQSEDVFWLDNKKGILIFE